MSVTRRGFVLYIAFVVSSVLLFLVLGSQDIVRLGLDMGRSAALETVGFHAADGGLERGLARLSARSAPFRFAYRTNLGTFRSVEVEVAATRTSKGRFDLESTATVRDGGREVARKRLSRRDVLRQGGRLSRGRFEEAS